MALPRPRGLACTEIESCANGCIFGREACPECLGSGLVVEGPVVVGQPSPRDHYCDCPAGDALRVLAATADLANECDCPRGRCTCRGAVHTSPDAELWPDTTL